MRDRGHRRDRRDGRSTDYRVIVENLSSRVSRTDLEDLMRSVRGCRVTYADVDKSRRNEGVVEFSRFDDVQKAIDKLDGTELKGRRIKIIADYR